MSFGAGLLTFVAFFPNWFPGLMFGILVGDVGWKAPKPIVDMIYERRVNKFIDPDGRRAEPDVQRLEVRSFDRSVARAW